MTNTLSARAPDGGAPEPERGWELVWKRFIAKDGHPDRVRYIYSLGGIAASVNWLATLIFAFLAWDAIPAPYLAIWVSITTLKCLYFYKNGRNVKKLRLRRISRRTLTLVTVFSGIFGLLFSPVGFFIFAMPFAQQIWALGLFWVLILGATFVYAPIPIAALSYMVAVMGPSIIWQFFLPEQASLAPVVMILLIVTLMVFSLKFSDITSKEERRQEEADRSLRLLEQAHQDIRRLAEIDSTTELRNRRSLMNLLEEKLREGGEGDYGLFIIDMDHFKHINDAYGHDFGDKYLNQLGVLMQETVRDRAEVARLGGDEFAVVTNKPMSHRQIVAIGNALLRDLTGSISIEGIGVRTGASIGVSMAPSLCSSVAEWLNFADHALRGAKNSQRGTIRVFEHGDRKQMHARNRLGLQLDRAIERNEITPWYQPQLNMDTGELMGFEALARWRSPSGIHVPPPQFFDLAEGRGVVLELCEQIFGRVRDDMTRWHAEKLDFGTMSVNVHPAQLHHTMRLTSTLNELIEAAGAPNKLTLEITENCIVGRGTEEIPAVLRQLADLGCEISLDDFGTGYASLTHIRSLPIQEVKIDRKFISELETSDTDREIVRAILRIAHLRNISVVAEGVEAGGQISLLRQEGCMKGQGFYFARPMPASDVPAYIRRLDEWHGEAHPAGGGA